MRSTRSFLAIAVLMTMPLVVTDAALAVGHDRGSTVRVTSGADDGPGSLRAAVDRASTDSSVRAIRLARGVAVDLLTPVVFEGTQDLKVSGRGNSISGASGDPATQATWDGGLLVSRSAADLTISHLHFQDSFNNGIAVFVPTDADGTVRVELHNTVITGSKFHGLFVDDQSSSGFNTDDNLHPNCVDPYPSASDASLEIVMRRSEIVANGTLAGGFDDSTATGCPRDFDGLRVDEGSAGGIKARFLHATVTENLADGVELDESGSGGVSALAARSSFDANGAAGSTIDGLSDLDDGFDIDEVGPGDLTGRFYRVSVDDNLDEGLDLDEAGEGDARAWLVGVTSDRNNDEGVKIDEEDGGSLVLRQIRSSASESLAEAGVALSETGGGNLAGRIVRSTISDNAGNGIVAEQFDAGRGRLRVIASDLSDNGGVPIDATGVEVRMSGSRP